MQKNGRKEAEPVFDGASHGWKSAHINKSMAIVKSINLNATGGVPKHPVPSATIRMNGLEGDKQKHSNHGGTDRAVLLYSSERITQLQEHKHPITPGSVGENLTISGLDWASLEENNILQIGDVQLQLTFTAVPCGTIRDSFFDYAWTICRDRWCAKVLSEGIVNVGDEVILLT
jgi:MOSC domain-containing protein YiiM